MLQNWDCCSLLCALRAQHHLQLQHQLQESDGPFLLLWQPRDQKQIAQQGAGEPLQQCEPALAEVMENPSQWHQYVLLLASFEMRKQHLEEKRPHWWSPPSQLSRSIAEVRGGSELPKSKGDLRMEARPSSPQWTSFLSDNEVVRMVGARAGGRLPSRSMDTKSWLHCLFSSQVSGVIPTPCRMAPNTFLPSSEMKSAWPGGKVTRGTGSSLTPARRT